MAEAMTKREARQARAEECDAIFERACLECTKNLTADPELHRLALLVMATPQLTEQAEAYHRLDDNIDRKVRAILASREKDERFHVGPLIVQSHVCPRKKKLVATVAMRDRSKRWSRQSIEIPVKAK